MKSGALVFPGSHVNHDTFHTIAQAACTGFYLSPDSEDDTE
jgi:hypothetical protein